MFVAIDSSAINKSLAGDCSLILSDESSLK